MVRVFSTALFEAVADEDIGTSTELYPRSCERGLSSNPKGRSQWCCIRGESAVPACIRVRQSNECSEMHSLATPNIGGGSLTLGTILLQHGLSVQIRNVRSRPAAPLPQRINESFFGLNEIENIVLTYLSQLSRKAETHLQSHAPARP